MSKMKNLLLKCNIETAQKKHYCKHNSKHAILKGDSRLTLVLNDGRSTKQYYCKECAVAMIKEAQARLSELSEQLK